MGIVCSGPSKNFIIPTMNGENGAFTEEIVVRLSEEGFCPSKLILHKGQCILFEWNVERPSPGFNVIQVSGTELNLVPGGFNSGGLAYSGAFKVYLGRKGQFNFASESLIDKLKTLKVQVLEKPIAKIKIIEGRFEQQFFNIQEGDIVQWNCENGDSEAPRYVQEMEYCFKHGGFISRKTRFEVQSSYERTFHSTGLYYFYLEKEDMDWVDDEASAVCVVKVTQTNREFVVHPFDEGHQPSLISARVQDRIWLECSSSKVHGSKSLDAYIYKDSLASPLVTSKLPGSSRTAELMSYQFTEPGLYHYVYNMGDLSQLRGCVVVHPKPKEHVIKITDGEFKPAPCTVYQGERVWWTRHDHEQTMPFILKELGCCTSTKGLRTRRKSLSTACGCKKVKDQGILMSLLGLTVHKFDHIGEFTYCLVQPGGTVSQSCCSVVVQRNTKHHSIKVHDQGFTPRILNVHPGDWVWWQWEATKRHHNITQVSHQRVSIPGGFDSGKPTCSASSFANMFTELGVFYFASNGLPEVFGAVVVTPESQVHKIHVTVEGIQPDPLVISVCDCVSWVWDDGKSYSVQEISQPGDPRKIVRPASKDPYKRCYSRVFNKPGMYHFLFTVHDEDESEVNSQINDSFMHSVLVDPISYSFMVGVTADGFKPSTLTIAKSQSVLWSWENQGEEKHNILHVRPPQDEQPLDRVRGLSAFDSGPKVTCSTFFHTFDVAGRYFITSEGTDRQLCMIDVLENASYVSPPEIPAAGRNGGNVECGYRVFLECTTEDAEIFYTINGSYPVECNAELFQYNNRTGIVLAQAGYAVIRAFAKRHGWVTSPVYTSKRFWVVEGDNNRLDESVEEGTVQHLETGSEEIDLKEEIFMWHWLSCRPNITVELVCDNTFNIYITLGNAADLTWIKGFQLFLNGTPYGGWFSPQCRALVVSGLIGGKVYHVVLVVFATQDSYEPQLSNQVVISCPLQASSRGPLVSLEAATTPQSLVIVWPKCDPAEVAAYSVFINGQPFGEQIVPEPDSDYCRVLFESSLQHEVYTLCVASYLSGSDVLLYSNEVEFSLPVPEEILSALLKSKAEEDSEGDEELDYGGVPARELLLVAERVIPESSTTEQSGIEKLSLKSVVNKLQTIHEDQQLDVVVADDDKEVMSNVFPTENGDAEPEKTEQQSDYELLDCFEGKNDAVAEEFVSVVKEEEVLEATPQGTSVPVQVEDDAYNGMIVELDKTVFRDLGESVFGKVTNVESLVKTTQINGTESEQLDSRGAGEVELGEQPGVVYNERNYHEEQGNGSSNEEMLDQSGITCHATVENDESDIKTTLDNETETFGMENLSDEQRDSNFWDHGEKQHEEGTTKDEILTNCHDATSQNNVDHDESKVTVTHPDIEARDNDTGKEHDVQEDSCCEGLEQVTYNVNSHEDEARERDVGLDANDGMIPELIGESNVNEYSVTEKDHSYSELDEAPKSGNVAESVNDKSAVNLDSGIRGQNDVNVDKENVQLNLEEPRESKDEEYHDSSDNAELTVAMLSKLDEDVGQGLKGDDTLKDTLAGDVEILQESANSVSLVQSKDISLPKEQGDEKRGNQILRENSKIDQAFPSKNVTSGENRTIATRATIQELKTKNLTPDKVLNTGDGTKESFETTSTTKGGKQASNEVSRDTWSASSNAGSIKDEDDDIKDVMETTEMPTFEETAFVSVEDNEGGGKRNERIPCGVDGFQGARLDTSHDDYPEDGFEQLLPRPLLVIKGTTPTAVTLEWEWTLLPEQIAGADIVYSVLTLGSKFHSNVNSSFCFNFEESPAKTMWPKQTASLKQHAWRTTDTVIEIAGLKQRCSYRLAVLGQLMPCANDCLSRVLSFTMPGPPKPPLIHVTDLNDREVTLTWKPPASFGDATLVGYRLLNDGQAYREDLDCDTLSFSLRDLEEGKHYSFSVLALTGHSVGDSKPSNAITVYCPTPPTSPQIYHAESTTVGSICIAWKHQEPAKTDNIAHAQCSYSVFVDGMLHGEYPLDGVTDIFTDEHTYTVPNCEVGRTYRLCVKSYLNPRVMDTGLDDKLYVCGCYGDSSNILELHCAGLPSPPIVRVSCIDQSGVTLSWNRSREYGGITLAGYVLLVNGKWSGELLPPEQQETKLTGFNPGDVFRVQMAAVASDHGVPISEIVNQEGDKLRCFLSSYEQPDSGVESSSSFLSKASADETKQFARSLGPPLVIQFSNFVRKVSFVEVTNTGCWSAWITWSLDDTADRSVEPEALSLSCWKATAQQPSAVTHIVKEKPFRIKDLEPGVEYYVMLECFAPHVNDDSCNERPINRAQSQSISFKTCLAPDPPSNIYVVSATEQSIKLAWDAPLEHGVPAAMIQLNATKTDHNLPDEGLNVQVSPDTNVYNFECLAAKTEYTFTLKALTEEDLLEESGMMSGSIASFSAWTNGVEPADKVHLASRAPTSLVIKWQPAVAYGMSTIQHYVVHYVQSRLLRKRSRGRVGQVKETGKELIVESERCDAELCELEPGTVYRIIVQTIAGLADYSYDEDFESEDSDTNSAISSAPSEKPPEVQRLHLSGPLSVCTATPPEPPVLLVRGFTATQIELSWNRPLVLEPVMDSQSTAGEDPARGRVRHLKGFRVEVNGRVYARLGAHRTSITLKKCKSGMKYTCVVVVMTCPEKSDGQQRKSGAPNSTVSDTDTDEDNKSLSDCFEESTSDPVEVTLPRQDWGVSLSANYCANKPAGSLRDSPCSESGEEEGGVEVRWKMTELAGDVSGYRLVWYSGKHNGRNEVLLPGDASGYEIWSILVSALYTFYLETLDVRKKAIAVFGPVHCQTPGPPSPPWIWCRTLSPYQITIEWNEPVTYGHVTIRGYQVYLNDRRLEKLVDRRQRRVNIHCQSSSVYRVCVVALGSDPQYGDSPPSNVLKLCTPVVQDSTMGRRPSGGVKRPAFDVTVNVLSTSNTSISFEWTHPEEIVDNADHYVIKWSSVLRPQVQELILPLIQTCHEIDDCSPGTSHFVVVAAVNADGGLVARSEQYTVQTSAPVKQPVLQLRTCLQSGITIEWRKPTTFGDAEIDYYQLMVNGEKVTELNAECSHYMFTDCLPCDQYTFLLKAISIKAACDSDWSEPLEVTCPGGEKPLITRIPSQQVNCIKVGWETPLLKGGAKVESFKVYYLEDKVNNSVTSEDVITESQSIQHGPLPRHTEQDKLTHVPPDSYYWVVLQVELLPEGCRSVCSQPIRTRAAVSPDPPVISLEVEGLVERRRLEERICELSNKRDRLHRIVHLLENSVVVKGSKLKDLQIATSSDTMLEVDSELADALEDIKEYTGSISTVIKWSRPRDDGDAVVSGYLVFVDGVRHGKILSQRTLQANVKLAIAGHVITVQTLSDHPVGPSVLSNAVELSGREFLPFVLFCYFGVHKRGERWPKPGCCGWDDSHSFEIKHRSASSGRLFIPRGVLARTIPCPVFRVMDVFSALWRPVAPVGLNKMVALLFWTKWCFSSQKVMEYFLQFAEEFMDKFSFVTCCVRSDEPVASHRQSLANILTDRGWRKDNDCVTHTCGCYPQSLRTRSVRRGVMSDPDVCQLFGLVGAPTLVLLDSSGYISWQGRCSCRDALSFRTFLLHAFSQVSQSLCPVSDCTHCELDKEDHQDTCTSEVEESAGKSSGQHRGESVELSSLYQRLHGPKPDGNALISSRPLTPQGFKKELIRPKTTTGAGRLARSSGYNRLSGFNEPLKTYSRSFSAYGGAQHSRPDTAGPGTVSLRSRTRTPQSSTESSSGEYSLPVVTRQRGKRTHPQERSSAPRIKTKISVEDFNLW